MSGRPHLELVLKCLYPRNRLTGLLSVSVSFYFYTDFLCSPTWSATCCLDQTALDFFVVILCVHLPSTRNTGTCHHAWLFYSLVYVYLVYSHLSNIHRNTNKILFFPVYKRWVCAEPLHTADTCTAAINPFGSFVLRLGLL